MIKRLVTATQYLVLLALLSILGFVVTSMVIGNTNPFGLQSPIAARAPFVKTPKLTAAEKVSFIQEQQKAAGYDSLSANAQATWNTVSDVLYKELGAYELRFELTDDPAKNCAQVVHHNQGGCYQQGGAYDKMIFVSPDIDQPNAFFIAHHEYSHYLQDQEGDNLRFSSDKECDADLRALELIGSWVPGFQYQCLQAGFTMEELTVENLPNLEARLKESQLSSKE